MTENAERTTVGLGVLRRERHENFSHVDEKMMECGQPAYADSSVTFSEEGDQTSTRCCKGN